MPWNPAQHRLFEFVAHDPAKAKAEGIDIKPSDAAHMAGEGIKKGKALGAAMRQRGTPSK
jgi:hypothetical protein